ncbi:hypothetical protein CAEBREN_08806 [Caenorhabditis brenneri]|uniref:Homeobox domain-containing protein n=1 Tax=Caenorhabditis brenneri TaxID=135651 RepID=G0NM31_CAEBE|nr:hypothetical protein CAEBREN_08806 [Caenorhabditis brenneri]
MSSPDGRYMSSSQSSILSGKPTPPSAVPTATPPPTPLNSIAYSTLQQVPFGNGTASRQNGSVHILQQPNLYYPWLINYQNPQSNLQLYPQYNYPFHQPQASQQLTSSHFGNQTEVLRKPRSSFTDAQVVLLEEQFRQSKFIGGSDREKLSKDTGLSEQQIKVWFQNKRIRMEKLKEPKLYSQNNHPFHQRQTCQHQPIRQSVNLEKVPRYRVSITNAQLTKLEERFKKNQYILKRERLDLAKAIGLLESEIRNWFQNKRQKLKKRGIQKEDQEETDVEIDICTFDSFATN